VRLRATVDTTHIASAAKQEQLPQTQTAMAAPQQVGRILVVDDDNDNRMILCERLQRAQQIVEQAPDGASALEILRSQDIDLVLLDILMPGMNGFEVLEQIHADPQLSRIPVIVLSALDDTQSIVRAIELGADDYLTKPYDPVLLNARIETSLFKKHLRDVERLYLAQIEEQRRRADQLLNVVIPIGIALSIEKGLRSPAGTDRA
jgi:adenylate cyclase